MFAKKLNCVVPVAVAAVFAVVLPAAAQTSLVEGFKDPPDIARPRVYWFWENGNITKEGITKDIEWMYRAGIRGMETFDIGNSTAPIVVKTPLLFMHDDWKDAFHHALVEADKRGMQITIGAAPGSSHSGGPWVKPADAMKKFVWTETAVEGGKPFHGVLPKPPEVNGVFQDQARAVRAGATPLPTLYKDQMVIAFRMPAGEKALEQARPTVTSSGGRFTYAELTTRTFANPVALPAEAGRASWIQIAFDTPQTVRGVTVATAPAGGRGGGGDRGGAAPSLEVSADGANFTKVIDVPGGAVNQQTLAFAPVTGRYFRYRVPGLGSNPTNIVRFQLHAATPVNRFEEKAAFAGAGVPDYYAIATVANAAGAVKKTDVINLTDKMRPDGTLDWTAPAGDWTVLRIGYSLTGQTNGQAPPDGIGFEVDKLNKTSTQTFLQAYMKDYQDASQGMMGQHGVNNIATDGWAEGYQNWTDGILAEFKQRRGYDPTPWVPALTGRVVESSEATDRFLWDFRRTIADLVIAANFEGIRDTLHEHGIKYVSAAMARYRGTIGDAMEMKTRADFPMGELWFQTGNYAVVNWFADVRDTASVAHIYSGKLATANTLITSGVPASYDAFSPWDQKATADEILLAGINQMTLHVSVLQPNDQAPGLALGHYGQWVSRLQTYANQERAWTDYLARSCYLLQQGQAVIDVGYFYGEEAPDTQINDAHPPVMPDGYNYDFVNKESLVNEFSVEGGKLTTKSGMKYQLLYLGGTSSRMTLPVLEKLRALATAGAVVVGLPPVDTPTLSDDPAKWQAAVKAIWPDKSVVRVLGNGKIYQTLNLSYVLGAESIQPDFAYVKPMSDANVQFYHRADGNTDIYFVNNRTDTAMTINANFRVAGRTAEIWQADRGTMQPASYTIHDGITTVPLPLESRDAVFVVFREPTQTLSRTVVAPVRTRLASLTGPWDVTFQEGRGAPKSATFAELSDWTFNTNPGIKYFSGEATYTKTIQIPALSPGQRVEVDLGVVNDLAEVAVNGKTEGIAWKPPYRVDITDGVKAGDNTLSIKVVNLWANRLIGDQQPGAAKVAFAPSSLIYTANSPLLPSGLMGPVGVDLLTEIK